MGLSELPSPGEVEVHRRILQQRVGFALAPVDAPAEMKTRAIEIAGGLCDSVMLNENCAYALLHAGLLRSTVTTEFDLDRPGFCDIEEADAYGKTVKWRVVGYTVGTDKSREIDPSLLSLTAKFENGEHNYSEMELARSCPVQIEYKEPQPL